MAIILTTRHIIPLWIGPGGLILMVDRTPERLRIQQKIHLAKNPAAVEPYVVSEFIEAYVGCGVWRVSCRCKEATHTDPEWGMACCFGCGAIYDNVIFPQDWRNIVALLALRPIQQHRNWSQPETYDDLMAEQVAHGDPTKI